jgi:hypothetical protein
MSEKASKWRAHQVAWRESGLSVAAYCRRHDLSYAQWMYWQRRLGASALIPIEVRASEPSPASVELALPGGAVLRVSGLTVEGMVALARGLTC